MKLRGKLVNSPMLSRELKNKLLIAAGCHIYGILSDVDYSEVTPSEFPP
jgi:hypothetical protein